MGTGQLCLVDRNYGLHIFNFQSGRPVVRNSSTNVSRTIYASIFKVDNLLPRKWKHHASPKRWYLSTTAHVDESHNGRQVEQIRKLL